MKLELFFQNDGQSEDMKYTDFQMIDSGTPVHDLSYFFYSFSNFAKGHVRDSP